MSELPLLFADVLPSGPRGFPNAGDYDGVVAPVEKTTETGELPPPEATTTSGTQVPTPPPAPAEPTTNSNLSLYISLLAMIVAVVALIALFKRGAFSPKAAE